MRIFTSFFGVLLVVGGVSGVEGKKVTVMKGDTVTLNPDDAEIKTGDTILWKFEGSIIGRRKSDGSISTYDGPGGIFKEKLLLDKLTGCLTITDLTTDHTGLYQLEIKNSTTETWINYSVTVSDGMKTVSVKKGDSVTLDTGLFEIKGYDLILWMSEGHVIAEINRTTNQALFSPEEKFNGRLQREHQTGSLIISDSRTTDSGDYHLNMSCSTFTLQRTITVTVTNVPVRDVPVTGLSLSEILLIVVVIVALIIIGFLVMKIKKR